MVRASGPRCATITRLEPFDVRLAFAVGAARGRTFSGPACASDATLKRRSLQSSKSSMPDAATPAEQIRQFRCKRSFSSERTREQKLGNGTDHCTTSTRTSEVIRKNGFGASERKQAVKVLQDEGGQELLGDYSTDIVTAREHMRKSIHQV